VKLDVKAFALTCAVVWGGGLPSATWWVIALDGPSTAPTWIGHIYRGYTLTLAGSLVGAAWAFFDGLVGGAVFAWLYDYLQAQMTYARRTAA
jgi:hypothetical protein